MPTKGLFSLMTGCIWSVVVMGVLLAAPAPFVSAQEGVYGKAVHAYLKKDYRTAVKHLREYVDWKPDAAAYYLLGYANYKLKNDREAAENFREAYLIDPDFTPKSLDLKKSRR